MIETVIFPIERFGCSAGADGLERGDLRATWPLRDIILFGSGSNLHDARPQLWQASSVASGEMPAIGSNSSDLKHHLSQRRRWLFWMRSLSIESVGLNLDLGDVNAEFLERRNC